MHWARATCTLFVFSRSCINQMRSEKGVFLWGMKLGQVSYLFHTMKHLRVSYPCFIPMFHTFLLRAGFIPMFHTSNHFQLFQRTAVGGILQLQGFSLKTWARRIVVWLKSRFWCWDKTVQRIITPQANAEVIPRQETTMWIEATCSSNTNLKICCGSFIPSFIPSFILVSYMFHTIQSDQRQIVGFCLKIFVVVVFSSLLFC